MPGILTLLPKSIVTSLLTGFNGQLDMVISILLGQRKETFSVYICASAELSPCMSCNE